MYIRLSTTELDKITTQLSKLDLGKTTSQTSTKFVLTKPRKWEQFHSQELHKQSQDIIQRQIQWLQRSVHRHHQYLHQCWIWAPYKDHQQARLCCIWPMMRSWIRTHRRTSDRISTFLHFEHFYYYYSVFRTLLIWFYIYVSVFKIQFIVLL